MCKRMTMENKNEASKNEESKNNQDSVVNEAADKIISDVKKFHVLSLVGLGLAAVFLVFMFVDALNFRWWLMLPIAGAGGFVLYRQNTDTRGFENKACYYGLIVLAVLFVVRDISMANRYRGSTMANAPVTSKLVSIQTKLDSITEKLNDIKSNSAKVIK